MKTLGSKGINKNYGNKIYFLNKAKREFGKFFKFPDALIIEPEEMEIMFPKYFFFLNGVNRRLNKQTANYIIREILRKESSRKKYLSIKKQ